MPKGDLLTGRLIVYLPTPNPRFELPDFKVAHFNKQEVEIIQLTTLGNGRDVRRMQEALLTQNVSSGMIFGNTKFYKISSSTYSPERFRQKITKLMQRVERFTPGSVTVYIKDYGNHGTYMYDTAKFEVSKLPIG